MHPCKVVKLIHLPTEWKWQASMLNLLLLGNLLDNLEKLTECTGLLDTKVSL